jgi:hypothetical protein
MLYSNLHYQRVLKLKLFSYEEKRVAQKLVDLSVQLAHLMHRGTSLIRKRNPLGP